MSIKESAENYLESIFMLRKKHGTVRSVDVAHDLGFSKASVSVAMKNLRQEDYITVDDEGEIFLTQKGMDIAQSMYERHNLIARALIALGVSEETAYNDSCKIEHDLSHETFEKLKDYIEEHLR